MSILTIICGTNGAKVDRSHFNRTPSLNFKLTPEWKPNRSAGAASEVRTGIKLTPELVHQCKNNESPL